MKIGPSPIIKHHSVVIHGRKTSVSLEPEFWNLLKIEDRWFYFCFAPVRVFPEARPARSRRC